MTKSYNHVSYCIHELQITPNNRNSLHASFASCCSNDFCRNALVTCRMRVGRCRTQTFSPCSAAHMHIQRAHHMRATAHHQCKHYGAVYLPNVDDLDRATRVVGSKIFARLGYQQEKSHNTQVYATKPPTLYFQSYFIRIPAVS